MPALHNQRWLPPALLGLVAGILGCQTAGSHTLEAKSRARSVRAVSTEATSIQLISAVQAAEPPTLPSDSPQPPGIAPLVKAPEVQLQPEEAAATAMHSLPEDTTSGRLQRIALNLDTIKVSALVNSTIVKRDADFLAPTTAANLDGIPSQFDPIIADSGFLFGQRGEQAARSDFDWRWSKQIGIGESELIQNNRFLSGGIPPGGTLRNRNGQYIYALSKNTQTGGQLRLSHQWDYLGSNVQDSFYPSSFSGFIRSEVRQPLLAGSGYQVTQVAGPLSGAIDGVTGVSQGIVISRIHTQEARLRLDLAVGELLRDVEILHQQLAASTAVLQVYAQMAEQAQRLVQQSQALVESQASGSRQDLLQIHQSRSQLEVLRMTELRNNATIANRLSRIVGQQLSAENVEPLVIQQPVPFVVSDSQDEISQLSRRADMRLLELQERSLRAQLAAARNLNRPQLDFVAGYNVNGFGDQLFAEGVPGPDRDTASAYENLFQNDHTGWDVRLELSSVLGRRLANQRERNLMTQLHKLAMARQDRFKDIQMEIQQTTRDIQFIYDTWHVRHQVAQSNFELINTIQSQQAASFQVDNLVRLATQFVEAAENQAALLRGQAEYQNALSELLYRQGRIVEQSGLQVR